MEKHITVTIEKLVFGGQALARTDEGQVVFVWNALPGETVEAEILKRKAGTLIAVATKILDPSPDRIEPKDDAYLSTSPWQMMTMDAENKWKKAIAAETYSKIGNMIIAKDELDIVSDNELYGYRNKMEFSFVEKEDGGISLAFYKRAQHHKIPVTGSSLASLEINETAQHILNWINKVQIPMRSLKSLIIRNDNKGKTLAALFIKDELPFETYPELNDQLAGFILYYSTHKSPASVPTKLLYSSGEEYLTTTIKECDLAFGALSFFQINVPMFEQALEDIAAFLDPKEPLIDYYGGVGAISLPLSLNRTECAIVDENKEAIDFAQKNIDVNNRTGCEAICALSEDMYDLINANKAIIVDPPRAGLHQKLVQRILIRRPPKIVYLSCGIDTQARDLLLLSEAYRPVFMKLYNFFPRTPHIEGLVVLERI